MNRPTTLAIGLVSIVLSGILSGCGNGESSKTHQVRVRLAGTPLPSENASFRPFAQQALGDCVTSGAHLNAKGPGLPPIRVPIGMTFQGLSVETGNPLPLSNSLFGALPLPVTYFPDRPEYILNVPAGEQRVITLTGFFNANLDAPFGCIPFPTNSGGSYQFFGSSNLITINSNMQVTIDVHLISLAFHADASAGGTGVPITGANALIHGFHRVYFSGSSSLPCVVYPGGSIKGLDVDHNYELKTVVVPSNLTSGAFYAGPFMRGHRYDLEIHCTGGTPIYRMHYDAPVDLNLIPNGEVAVSGPSWI